MRRKPAIVSRPVNTRGLDALDVNGRLYRQISKLLDQLDEGDEGAEPITIRERIAALVAIGRIQVMFMGLRKEDRGDSSGGTKVRKYSTAFQAANANRRGKTAARSARDAADDAVIADALRDDGDDDGPGAA